MMLVARLIADSVKWDDSREKLHVTTCTVLYYLIAYGKFIPSLIRMDILLVFL